jgi:hypothetical protein
MSTKKKQITTERGGVPISFRLEKELLASLQPHAKRGRRKIGAQLNLVVEEWLRMQSVDKSQPFATSTLTTVQKRTPPVTPAEVAKYALPQDFTGMGSIPPPAPSAGPEPAEDAFLPPDDGSPLIPGE